MCEGVFCFEVVGFSCLCVVVCVLGEYLFHDSVIELMSICAGRIGM